MLAVVNACGRHEFIEPLQLGLRLLVMAFDPECRGNQHAGDQQRGPAAFGKFHDAEGNQDAAGQQEAETVDEHFRFQAGSLSRSSHQCRTMPSCDRLKVMKTLML